MSESNPTNPEESRIPAPRIDSASYPVDLEGVSISGDDALRIGKSLVAYAGGKLPLALGPGFDRADDGTLRLTVDKETWIALQFDTDS